MYILTLSVTDFRDVFVETEVPKLWGAPGGALLVHWGGGASSFHEGHLF
jgi:hypothetical protein